MNPEDLYSKTKYPPLPPSSLEDKVTINKFIPGEFNYIKNNNYKIMLLTAWKAITELELWDFLKLNIESFVFSTDPRIIFIYDYIQTLGYDGHSGASFGNIMREMQFIAKNGEEEFRNIKLKTL